MTREGYAETTANKVTKRIYKRDEACPMCGATPSHQKRKPSSSLVDLSNYEPKDFDPECEYMPEEWESRWDEDDREWTRPDVWSAGFDCTKCKGTMLGGDLGWFDFDGDTPGRPHFDYCPYCGRKVRYDRAKFDWRLEE